MRNRWWVPTAWPPGPLWGRHAAVPHRPDPAVGHHLSRHGCGLIHRGPADLEDQRRNVADQREGLHGVLVAAGTPGKSNCNGSCAKYWPPVKGPVTAMAGVTGKFGTITRSEGAMQETWNEHPLYTYAADSAPGQAKGSGLNLSGGVWHEVTISGTAAPAPAKSSSSGGGYGY